MSIKNLSEITDWRKYSCGYKCNRALVLLPTKENGYKYNYINRRGKLISKVWFDDAYFFTNSKALIYIRDKGWNIIDIYGNYIYDMWFFYIKIYSEYINCCCSCKGSFFGDLKGNLKYIND